MKIPKWIPYFLIFAGLYNLIWGIFIFISPLNFWNLLHPKATNFPWWVYLLGFVVSTLGFLYIWASQNPRKYYGIVILGLLTKTLGPVVDFWFFHTEGLVLENLLWFMFVNDILWILPFVWVLRSIYRYSIK